MKPFYIGAILFLGLSMSSCFKDPNYDTTPKISFKAIKKTVVTEGFSGAKSDKITISLDFQDGDGDLGLSVQDIKDPKYNNRNYFLSYLRKKNGQFVAVQNPVLQSLYFERLVKDDRIGSIEGTLDYSVSFLQTFTPRKDTVKFRVSIQDRALHLSNEVETKEIILNE